MGAVKRYERERLLSEQRGHGDTVRSAFERRALERDMPDNALLREQALALVPLHGSHCAGCTPLPWST